MNLSEFKAWFEGFTEGMTAAPNAKQWKRIQDKIDKIEDAPPTTKTVFIDHWERPWRRWFDHPYYSLRSSQSPAKRGYAVDRRIMARGAAPMMRSSAKASMSIGDVEVPDTFDSGTAFRDLGRAEAKSMRA